MFFSTCFLFSQEIMLPLALTGQIFKLVKVKHINWYMTVEKKLVFITQNIPKVTAEILT